MPHAFGRDNYNYNRGYQDGLKWGVYDYNIFPGPDYDAGFMAGYFEREGRPFTGETYTQREQARKQAQYQNNSKYAQTIFGASNPVTIQTTAILKALAFLVIVAVISSMTSLFDGDKTSKKVQQNSNYQKEELINKKNSRKRISASDIVGTLPQNDIPKNTQPQTISRNQNIDWKGYMSNVERRIKLNWTPPKGSEGKIVKTVFKISKDGELLEYKVTQSSGFESVDKSAIDAIRLTAPFQPLPENYTGESISVEFDFDYHKVEK